MEGSIHQQVLAIAFVLAALLGAVVNKTNFCTMGAVSDWVNMGDSGRMRSWLLAMGVAVVGLLALDLAGLVALPANTFPPYRTAEFAWPRYLLGGALFGVGMTLASGCGNKTLVRIGGGNLKSLVVLAIASTMAYLMLWSDFYGIVFDSWMAPLTINLGGAGIKAQTLDGILGGVLGMENTAPLHMMIGGALVIALAAYAFSSADFRENRDNILGGVVIGLAVVAGWYLTGGSMGQEWRDFADMAETPPSRVQVQSLTFISPMGDLVRYLLEPTNPALINFGIVALVGVVVGSFLYAVISRSFRLEWFPSFRDFAFHAAGGALMGIGGVLAMGCTIGQGVTGFSTLAAGSILTFAAIVAGAAATMKLQFRLL
jgi:hypothetical protein